MQVNVKAVLNTVMVLTGWKKPGAFKVTAKAKARPAKPVGEGVIACAAPEVFLADGGADCEEPETWMHPANEGVPPEYWGYADAFDDRHACPQGGLAVARVARPPPSPGGPTVPMLQPCTLMAERSSSSEPPHCSIAARAARSPAQLREPRVKAAMAVGEAAQQGIVWAEPQMGPAPGARTLAAPQQYNPAFQYPVAGQQVPEPRAHPAPALAQQGFNSGQHGVRGFMPPAIGAQPSGQPGPLQQYPSIGHPSPRYGYPPGGGQWAPTAPSSNNGHAPPLPMRPPRRDDAQRLAHPVAGPPGPHGASALPAEAPAKVRMLAMIMPALTNVRVRVGLLET